MKRIVATFPIQDYGSIKHQLLYWSGQYSSCSFLDSNEYAKNHSNAVCIVGVGMASQLTNLSNNAAIDQYISQTNDWIFGHINYEFAQQIIPTKVFGAKPSSPIGFQPIALFQPEIVVLLTKTSLRIETIAIDPQAVFSAIIQTNVLQYLPLHTTSNSSIKMAARLSKSEYIAAIEQLLQHIHRGDCYEINYCQEFFAIEGAIHPLDTYKRLTQISPNPFACYYRMGHSHLLCASPERFLRKKGQQLISQPIKGTNKRDLNDKTIDAVLKDALKESPKERAENVMVVDLVRNDLSRICTEGSVQVSELFGLYSFPHVHQMISTVEGCLRKDVAFSEIMAACFPMGSMTGAPKNKVMQLIDAFEPTQRGLYSGAVGYITPDKDFDFNVVIRSILYNDANNALSYSVGSGITNLSNPIEEYEECMLKATAIQMVLGNA